FALGAGSDPRLVQWPSQQTLTTWTPTAGNSAGSFPLQTGGRLVGGLRMDRETLLYTDADLWSAVYIGGPLFYSFARRGDQCGMLHNPHVARRRWPTLRPRERPRSRWHAGLRGIRAARDW